MFRLFILLMDLVNKSLLNGSPSSTLKLSLITFSSVILFPKIFTFERYCLGNSLIWKTKFNLFFDTISSLKDASNAFGTIYGPSFP